MIMVMIMEVREKGGHYFDTFSAPVIVRSQFGLSMYVGKAEERDRLEWVNKAKLQSQR